MLLMSMCHLVSSLPILVCQIPVLFVSPHLSAIVVCHHHFWAPTFVHVFLPKFSVGCGPNLPMMIESMLQPFQAISCHRIPSSLPSCALLVPVSSVSFAGCSLLCASLVVQFLVFGCTISYPSLCIAMISQGGVQQVGNTDMHHQPCRAPLWAPLIGLTRASPVLLCLHLVLFFFLLFLPFFFPTSSTLATSSLHLLRTTFLQKSSNLQNLPFLFLLFPPSFFKPSAKYNTCLKHGSASVLQIINFFLILQRKIATLFLEREGQ